MLYNVGDKNEPCGGPASVSLGVDISLSIETEFSMRRNKANQLD
jgi:hypothetical protein